MPEKWALLGLPFPCYMEMNSFYGEPGVPCTIDSLAYWLITPKEEGERGAGLRAKALCRPSLELVEMQASLCSVRAGRLTGGSTRCFLEC